MSVKYPARSRSGGITELRHSRGERRMALANSKLDKRSASLEAWNVSIRKSPQESCSQLQKHFAQLRLIHFFYLLNINRNF